MKHIIIGAGITGLYTACKLIKVKHIDPTKIIIFEKTQRVGGRIYTYQNYDHPQYRYDVGAGRLGSKHKYVMKLIIFKTRYNKRLEFYKKYIQYKIKINGYRYKKNKHYQK